MRTREGKNAWSLFLALLAGIVIGGFIGHYLADVPFAGWLAYGQSFGLDEPLSLELGIIRLRFGILLRINVAGVIGMLIGAFLYKRVL